jgi:PAS domain S-box-containing protein
VRAQGVANNQERLASEASESIAALKMRVATLEQELASQRAAQVLLRRESSLAPRPERVLEGTAVGVNAATGEEFFRLLARHLADSLGCEYAEVGVLADPGAQRIRTLALVSHGEVVPNLEYDLEGTPCFTVVNRELCLYPERVQQRFPQDQFLVDWQVEAYAGTPLFTTTGEPLGLICVLSKRPFVDPTAVSAALRIFAVRAAAEIERLRTEESLRLSEERFRQIAENVRDVFWLYDFDVAKHVYVSPSFESVWQRPVEWLLADSRRWLDTVHEDERDKISHFFDGAITGMLTDLTYRIRRPDGTVRWIHGRRFPVSDASGRVYRIAGVAEDVTERIEAGEKLHAQAAQLAHVARLSSMGELVASIAHEVNQPLHVITVFASTIAAALAGEGQWQPSDLAKWNEEIAKAGGRAAEIIRRLRTYVSPGPSVRTSADLNLLIRESVELIGVQARQSRVYIQLELAPSPLIIEADSVAIEQVLVNLLRNALDACADQAAGRRSVVVRSRNTADGPLVTVRDEGSGLDVTTLDRLFTPFFTTKPKGMGMGLAICKTIVESHGGRIWAEPNADRGATFAFVVPHSRQDPPSS